VLPFGNTIDLLARLHAGQTKAVASGTYYGYLALKAGKIRSALGLVSAGKDALF
jgi:hypothetical protein